MSCPVCRPCPGCGEHVGDLRAEVERLKSERDRLRAAIAPTWDNAHRLSVLTSDLALEVLEAIARRVEGK